MRIHHLNCGSFCPIGIHGTRSLTSLGDHARFVCHCLVVETTEGLVLIDTGMGLRDTLAAHRLPLSMRMLMRPRLDPAESAVRQLPRLGLPPEDVRHIVLTHLDFDHAGGIDDFPHACIHVAESELRAATRRRTLKARTRYCPSQWARDVAWRPFSEAGEPWFGFETVRALDGLPPEILIVPLPGHTVGHCGVAVQTPSGWFFHAGDAYFHHDQVHTQAGAAPKSIERYESFMEVDRKARLSNQARLRSLVHEQSDRISVICSHDISELEIYEARDRNRLRPRNRLATTSELQTVQEP